MNLSDFHYGGCFYFLWNKHNASEKEQSHVFLWLALFFLGLGGQVNKEFKAEVNEVYIPNFSLDLCLSKTFLCGAGGHRWWLEMEPRGTVRPAPVLRQEEMHLKLHPVWLKVGTEFKYLLFLETLNPPCGITRGWSLLPQDPLKMKKNKEVGRVRWNSQEGRLHSKPKRKLNPGDDILLSLCSPGGQRGKLGYWSESVGGYI